MNYRDTKYKPALFVPVRGIWIREAFEYLKNKNTLYFYTDSNIGSFTQLTVSKIFFKLKGNDYISVMADLIDITTVNPVEYRLKDNANLVGKYYYGFSNLKLISQIKLNTLKHFKSGISLRNDVPGVFLIVEPIYQTIE